MPGSRSSACSRTRCGAALREPCTGLVARRPQCRGVERSGSGLATPTSSDSHLLERVAPAHHARLSLHATPRQRRCLHREALPPRNVDHRQDPQRPTIARAVVHAVHRPPTVRRRRDRADRTREQRLASLRPPKLQRQRFFAVQSIRQLVVDLPAFTAQQQVQRLLARSNSHDSQLSRPTAQRLSITPDTAVAQHRTPHFQLNEHQLQIENQAGPRDEEETKREVEGVGVPDTRTPRSVRLRPS